METRRPLCPSAFDPTGGHRAQHICQIYTRPEERMEAVHDFLRTAIQSGDRTYYISERPTIEVLADYLSGFGLSLPDALHTGQCRLDSSRDFYLRSGVFDPFKVLTQWGSMLREAAPQGHAKLWAIGDVMPELGYLCRGTQLTIYEAKLDEWMQSSRATVVCQYDARAFDACTLIGMLRIHPLVLANRRVVESPYYAPPERKLSH